MSRLLTPEEKHKAHGQWGAQRDVSWEDWLLHTQDAKTREETLQECGEWIKKKINDRATIEWREIDMLKQGKAPWEKSRGARG